MPSQIGSRQLRSSSAHCVRQLAKEDEEEEDEEQEHSSDKI